MEQQRRVYGRRIGSALFEEQNAEYNTPCSNGMLYDLMVRTRQDTPTNEKWIRGMY